MGSFFVRLPHLISGKLSGHHLFYLQLILFCEATALNISKLLFCITFYLYVFCLTLLSTLFDFYKLDTTSFIEIMIPVSLHFLYWYDTMKWFPFPLYWIHRVLHLHQKVTRWTWDVRRLRNTSILIQSKQGQEKCGDVFISFFSGLASAWASEHVFISNTQILIYRLSLSLSLLQFNFVGKLLGPRGNSLKRLQEDTLTKMSILGKGSMREKEKVTLYFIFLSLIHLLLCCCCLK